MTEKLKLEVNFRDDKTRSSLEILVPKGMSHKELYKVNLGKLLAKFRPSGCQACLCGQDLIIRERFEKVLPIDIAEIEGFATH